MASYGSNPFAPPAPIDPAVDADARVFTAQHVAIATFLGSGLAGGVLLALNERRLGGSSAANHIAVGIAVTVATVVLSWVIPLRIGMLLALPGIYAMRAYAQHAQGARVQPLIEAGRKEGGGMVALVGLGMLALLLGTAMASGVW